MSEKTLFRRKLVHSKLCTWDGKSNYLTHRVGNCLACDDIKTVRMNGNSERGIYGIDRKDYDKYCRSSIQWPVCTKHTNPSCACGKPVL